MNDDKPEEIIDSFVNIDQIENLVKIWDVINLHTRPNHHQEALLYVT